MKQTKPIEPHPHSLTSSDRRTLSMTGIVDVDSFDDKEIVAFTDIGRLAIGGEGLHITRLSLENGELDLEGYLVSLTYSEAGAHRKGLFGRLFR